MMVHDSKGRERADRELEIYQKFKENPNFLRLYDYEIKKFSDGTEQYSFLLRYYPRGSLHEIIKEMNNENMTESKILEIFLQICNAVRSLHESDPPLCHRDIKPHNILLDVDDTAILIDFASVAEARANVLSFHSNEKQEYHEDALETSTPSYRSPELFDLGGVFSDEVIDERVDIWSLGCLLYAMAYHQNPFDNAILRGGDLKLAVINGKVDIPYDSIYSEEFNNLIKIMINIHASERPYINEVINNVENLLENV